MPIEMASQDDAALVVAMAESAQEDGECLEVMLLAGCTEAECRAALKGEVN
jgi:hypothetical protein